MKKVILTIILTLVFLVIVFAAYIYSGAYDVSQTTPHKSITQWIINKTTHHSILKRMKGTIVPDLEDTEMIADGFIHYNEMCLICHGAPGIDPSVMTKGLYPGPPRILKPEDIVSPDMAFWIIKNGIKMTSMPAFAPTHSDEDIWEMTAFMINKMVKMTPEEYQQMMQPPAVH